MITPEQATNSEARRIFLKNWEDSIDRDLSIHGYVKIYSEDYRKIKELVDKYVDFGFQLIPVYDTIPHDYGFGRSFSHYLLRVKEQVEATVEPVEPTPEVSPWWSRFF
jgi:predicted AlkP superfamily phosphohydrolase/phosphomutase